MEIDAIVAFFQAGTVGMGDAQIRKLIFDGVVYSQPLLRKSFIFVEILFSHVRGGFFFSLSYGERVFSLAPWEKTGVGGLSRGFTMGLCRGLYRVGGDGVGD